MPEKKVEIISEEVQDILGHIPHWIIRWGISVIFLSILVLLIGSYFFKFPDIITSSIIVTTENPPAAIIARTNGKIDHIWVKDKETISEGSYLALIQNPVNFNHYSILIGKIDSLNGFIYDFDSIKAIEFSNELILGDIQGSYNDFVSKYDEFYYSLNLDFYNQKIAALNNQIEKHNFYYSRLWSQRNILEEELQIVSGQYERDKKLFAKNVISKVDFEKSKSKMLQKQFEFEQARSTLANTKMQLQEIEQQILDLQLESSNIDKQRKSKLKDLYNKLKSDIKTWEHNYLLKAPIDGYVSFTKFWSENQNVIAGDRVFTVVPEDTSKMTGRITLSIQGSGKVEEKQRVNIKFESFPYMEYGIVSGVIRSISLVPEDNHLIAEVDFTNGLRTNYGKTLIFSQEMQGTAEIITEEVRLLEKLFNPIRSIFEKQKIN